MSDGKGVEALVPLSAITRPLDTPVDEAKVSSLMATLRDPATAGDVPPITLLWLTGDEGGQYYFSFGRAVLLQLLCQVSRLDVEVLRL